MTATIRSLLVLSLLLATGTTLAGEVRLAIATNFHDAAERLAAQFAEATGHSSRISYGSTGKLYAQIRHGAPFDVFLAADQERPRLMEQNGSGVPGTRFTYAVGKLVLWSPDPQAFKDPVAFLRAGDFRRLAIANPGTAPYGLAARQTLENLDLWPTLESRLVRGESIAQTFSSWPPATQKRDLWRWPSSVITSTAVPAGKYPTFTTSPSHNRPSFWNEARKTMPPRHGSTFSPAVKHRTLSANTATISRKRPNNPWSIDEPGMANRLADPETRRHHRWTDSSAW